jgi:hypothetical protein
MTFFSCINYYLTADHLVQVGSVGSVGMDPGDKGWVNPFFYSQGKRWGMMWRTMMIEYNVDATKCDVQ